jgi:hypothetical protein
MVGSPPLAPVDKTENGQKKVLKHRHLVKKNGNERFSHQIDFGFFVGFWLECCQIMRSMTVFWGKNVEINAVLPDDK